MTLKGRQELQLNAIPYILMSVLTEQTLNVDLLQLIKKRIYQSVSKDIFLLKLLLLCCGALVLADEVAAADD